MCYLHVCVQERVLVDVRQGVHNYWEQLRPTYQRLGLNLQAADFTYAAALVGAGCCSWRSIVCACLAKLARTVYTS